MKLRLLSLLLLTLVLTPVLSLNQTDRMSKFLGLFHVVRFTNTMCNANGDRMGGEIFKKKKKKSKIFKYLTAGVCYTAAECRDMHGSAEGSCAQGFGTCCVFIYNGVDKNKKEVLGRRISYIEHPSRSSALTRTLEIKANNKGGIKRKPSTGL